jgi:hypothetical protein
MQQLDWTPWRQPRLAERGVETVHHHPLVLVRRGGNTTIEVARPVDVLISDGEEKEPEWSPMPWATRGRRNWCTYPNVELASTFAGEDGHIFHANNAVCEQLFEGGCFSDTGLARWVQLFENRVAWCSARGIAYRTLVIPEHHAIYPDKVPGNPKLADDRPLLRILASASQQVRDATIYPLDAMRAGRAKHETSLPNDVHIAGYGAFLCYREIMRTLPHCAPERIVEEEELVLKELFVAGDVGRARGLPGRKVPTCKPPHTQVNNVVKGSSYKPNQIDVFETSNADLPRLVLFRTSNSTHLFPFLFRHFSRVAAVATRRMFFELVESEKPDVVLAEMAERSFAGLAPIYFDGHDLTSIVRDDAPGSFFEATGFTLPLPGRAAPQKKPTAKRPRRIPNR